VSELGQFFSPAFREELRVGFVAQFAPRRRAHVMIDYASLRDCSEKADLSRAQAEINVLTAVDEGRVEAAELAPRTGFDQQAGTGDGGYDFNFSSKRRKRAVMHWLAFGIHNDAGVIDYAGGDGALHVADNAGGGMSRECGEHRVQPPRREDQVVVEEDEKVAGGGFGGTIVTRRVAEVAVVEEYAETVLIFLRAQPVARAVSAAVVDEDDLVVEVCGKGGLQGGEHRLREGEAVVERNEKRDAHVSGFLNR
jgi:hypothetical protein